MPFLRLCRLVAAWVSSSSFEVYGLFSKMWGATFVIDNITAPNIKGKWDGTKPYKP